MSLANDVLIACRARGWRLAAAESCTGGLLTGALTDIPGSSDVLDRGFVTYSNAAKEQMLGVPAEMLAAHGAVSEEVAGAMAEGALAGSEASIAIAVTGVAGPGGTADKPEGMVCFGVIDADGPVLTVTHRFGPLGRFSVRKKSVATALEMVLARLGAPNAG